MTGAAIIAAAAELGNRPGAPVGGESARRAGDR